MPGASSCLHENSGPVAIHGLRHAQVVDVFIRCSTVPIAVVAPMYAPFYDSTARERLPETDPLLSFSVRRRAAHCSHAVWWGKCCKLWMDTMVKWGAQRLRRSHGK